MKTDACILEVLRRAAFARSVAAVVLVAFTLLLSEPLAAAYHSGAPGVGPGASIPAASGQQMGLLLRDVRAALGDAERGLRLGHAIAQERGRLNALRNSLVELDAQVRHDFDEVATLLEQRGVPAVAMGRHHATVLAYRNQMKSLLEDLTLVEQVTDAAELSEHIEQAQERLAVGTLEPGAQPFDPLELPHGPQLPREGNLPKTLKDQYTDARLFDSPPILLAAAGEYRFDSLPGADEPAYLSETAEVRITEAIHDKAAELDHDPVAIYHWVRNNVFWAPTWGAVQDADLTLSALQGNAMDISSLLIALLRAAGVPARYVHGTVDLPEEQFRNWVGGFTQVEEAMAFAASGGIPLMGVVRGGRVAAVRMEHVWVEAAVDFLPSRAAVMRDADTWLPLDPSFKQYAYTAGLDFAAITGIDPAAVARDFLASGTLDETEGWAQGLQTEILESAQQLAEHRVRAYIDALDEPTVGDVLGERRAIRREGPVLPSGLPYQPLLEGARYATLPEDLQARIALAFDSATPGVQLESVEFPWASLNNRKVTLSFRPATAADEQTLLALLPEGEISDVGDLPDSIPAYLVTMLPEFKVDGVTVLTGDPVGLGAEIGYRYRVIDPVFGQRDYPNKVAAGSYLALGVIGSEVAPMALDGARNRLANTALALDSGLPSLLEGLSREALLGDLFHAGLLIYFAQLQTLGRLSTQMGGSHYQPTTSAGTFGYVPNVWYLFGIPHTLTPGKVVMDLDRVAHVTSTDGKGPEAWKNLNVQLGTLASALEHAVPEQLFLPPEHEGEGVSAVKALQKAVEEGQRIYHITSANQDSVLPNVRQNALTMNEIRNAVSVGREVFVHADPIQVPGWQGAGYIILDPQTGAGAWKIAGGANGGLLSDMITTVSKPLFIIGAMIGSSTLLSKVKAPFTDFVTAFRQTSNFLVGVSALMTFREVYVDTQSPLKAISGVAVDVAIAYAAGATGKAIFGLLALSNPVTGAIVITITLGVLAGITRQGIIDQIISSLLSAVRLWV